MEAARAKLTALRRRVGEVLSPHTSHEFTTLASEPLMDRSQPVAMSHAAAVGTSPSHPPAPQSPHGRWSTTAAAVPRSQHAQQGAVGHAVPSSNVQLKEAATMASEAAAVAMEVLSLPLEERDVLLSEDLQLVAAQARGVINTAVNNVGETVSEAALCGAVEALDLLSAVMAQLATPHTQQPQTQQPQTQPAVSLIDM